MSAFQINLNPLKEPLGFIKILEWVSAACDADLARSSAGRLAGRRGPGSEGAPALEGRGAEMAAGDESPVRGGFSQPPLAAEAWKLAGFFFPQAPPPSAKEDRTSCCGPTDTDRPEARAFRGRG